MHLNSLVTPLPSVAEIQGLYGPFSFPEKLLQKIWHRGDFASDRAVTKDGHGIQIIRAGKWNLLGGPDFKNASIRIGTTISTGDVEVHLRASDWVAHGHARDPAYRKVILHVVLFAEDTKPTLGFEAQEIPVLAMLPLLRHDLEEYAADEAVERLAHHPLSRAEEKLRALSEEALRSEMVRHAKLRWENKVHYARVRVGRLGWEAACHETALEILGYRFNRATMLSIAVQYPLSTWAQGDPLALAEQAYVREKTRWKLQGVRPANHPCSRLNQYARWICARPDWPQRLAEIGAQFGTSPLVAPPAAETELTSELRRNFQFRASRERIAREVCGGAVGGTRLDTLICDGFLPLLAAREGRVDSNVLNDRWFHWFLGDVPCSFLELLKALALVDGRRNPASHGLAQGLLGWLLTQEQGQ